MVNVTRLLFRSEITETYTYILRFVLQNALCQLVCRVAGIVGNVVMGGRGGIAREETNRS